MTTKKQIYKYIALVNIGTSPMTMAGGELDASVLPKGSLAIHLKMKNIKKVRVKKDEK